MTLPDPLHDNHRFIPALAQIAGATVAEVPIKNINAPYRPSNYGFGRTFPAPKYCSRAATMTRSSSSAIPGGSS